MKIFETKDIREIDIYTIHHEPVSSVNLMERAAGSCISWIKEHYPVSTPFIIFTGPGNNGGDGWAVARLLTEEGYTDARLYHLDISNKISDDSAVNKERLIQQGKVSIHYMKSVADFPVLSSGTFIIDALFGSGLTRPPEGLSAEIIRHINASDCEVISIDIPSGLFGEDNSVNNHENMINACHTLTFEFPKRSFFFHENEKHTGRFHVISIGLHPEIMERKKTEFFYTLSGDVYGKIRKRNIFSHKGTYGHALLIAGSYGMIGAAILSAKACMRTGTGLLTSHICSKGYPVMQTVVPESIFSIDPHGVFFSTLPALDGFSAIGAGPGLGKSPETVAALEGLLKSCRGKPLVLDADALNILATYPHLISLLPENTVLTPHPVEFDRLVGVSANGYERNQAQIDFSRKHKVIVVLKGAYTSVTLPDGTCHFNSTGNPGMATAGAGDVLTGMILSLLAQQYEPSTAAILGVFLHGLAGDIAAEEKSQHSLIATDIIEYIGNAFNSILDHEKPVDI